MTTTKQDIDATLARLAEAFPQTFVLEKYRPHWPLKVGIAAAIPARCPALEWRVLKMALTAYTGRIMYLRGLVEGAARLDLDGNRCGEVTAGDAEYAAAKLAEILASREAAAEAGATPAGVPSKVRMNDENRYQQRSGFWRFAGMNK
jgi:ProP effector